MPPIYKTTPTTKEILFIKKPKNQTNANPVKTTPLYPEKYLSYQEIDQGSDCLIILCASVYVVIWVESTMKTLYRNPKLIDNKWRGPSCY